MFDAADFLGICDKIVSGLVIAAQAFGEPCFDHRIRGSDHARAGSNCE
jgi:hypothetical protein